MIFSVGNNIATLDGNMLTYSKVPIEETQQVLVAVIQTQDYLRPLPQDVDLSDFTHYPVIAGEPVEILFPSVVGYVAFALAENIPLRTRWRISDDDRGDIGGSHDDVFPNLWPSPITRVHNGVNYRVYWTSYATLINYPVQLWA
jgi:hypothetical protein